LLAAENADGRATIMLAHEALFLEWPALRDWLDCHRAELQRVQTLIAAFSDADPEVREKAVAALGRIGPAAEDVVPALITALALQLRRAFEVGLPSGGLVASSPGGPSNNKGGFDLALG
jgi:hypothetical protein